MNGDPDRVTGTKQALKAYSGGGEGPVKEVIRAYANKANQIKL